MANAHVLPQDLGFGDQVQSPGQSVLSLFGSVMVGIIIKHV